MSHKDFLTPVTCVKMLGPGNILGIFWVDFWVPHKTSNMGDILGIISGRIRQVTRPRLEEKKTGQTPSISPVFGQRHPESEQNSVKFSTKGFACSHLWFRNRSERQILEAKKKIPLSVAYISMSNISTSPPSNLMEKCAMSNILGGLIA